MACGRASASQCQPHRQQDLIALLKAVFEHYFLLSPLAVSV
jgi:hypothetical protein